MSKSARELNNWFIAEVQPHEPVLRSYLTGKLPDSEDVNDVIQHSYARLFRLRDRESVGNPKAFLFQAARNAVCDFYRRRDVVSFEHLSEESALKTRDSSPTADVTASLKDEIEYLMSAIDQLPERCSVVVRLRVSRGFSIKEIAAELGISANTVKGHMAKGMRLIAKYFAGLNSCSAVEEGTLRR